MYVGSTLLNRLPSLTATRRQSSSSRFPRPAQSRRAIAALAASGSNWTPKRKMCTARIRAREWPVTPLEGPFTYPTRRLDCRNPWHKLARAFAGTSSRQEASIAWSRPQLRWADWASVGERRDWAGTRESIEREREREREEWAWVGWVAGRLASPRPTPVLHIAPPTKARVGHLGS